MAAFDYKAGLGAIVIAVPAAKYVSSIAAACSAPGASVQIGAGDLIPVPVGGTVSVGTDGGLVGPVNITFVGTTMYFVGWFDSPTG
jgi:hypothetical protein